MACKQVFGVILACVALWPHESRALFGDPDKAAMRLTLQPQQTYTELKEHQIYKLTYKCTAIADLKNSNDAKLFIRKNQTSSHYILINNKLASTDAAGNPTFPSDAVAFLPVFAINNGVVKINNCTAYPDPQYITGAPGLYLQAYANYSTANQPGILLSLGYGVAGLIPPLWAMFRGELSEGSQALVANFPKTEDPLKKTLSALDKENNFPASAKLGVGTYVITTAFSKVEISVNYVPSIIREGGSSAMRFFRKQIDTAVQKIEANSIDTQCTALATELLDLGFSKVDDIPFALAYKGIRSNLNASQASQCLGRDYAVAAASIPGGLWEYAGRSEQRLSPEHALADWPPESDRPYQAAFNEARMKIFTDALSRLTRSDTMTPGDQTAFSKTLVEPISLDDRSVKKAFDGEPRSYTGAALASFFVGKGYRRFGCYQSTNLGEKLDGGKTLLLAFKADKDDVTLTVDGMAILKPIFTPAGAIKMFFAYDDYDWINTVMTQRGWVCGRIAVTKPTPAPAVAAPPAEPAGSAAAAH
jgi:hypothetical protein